MRYRPRFVGRQELPWPADPLRPETRHEGAEAYWRDVAPVARSLAAGAPSDLVGTHTLFNAGLLRLALPRDPVELHWAEHGLTDPPYVVELGTRYFAGLPAPFDRVLFACPTPLWPGLCRTLDRLQVVVRHPDRAGRATAWWSTHFTGSVLDCVLARRLTAGRPAPPAPPLVPVHLFGLASTLGEYYWEPPGDPWREPVKLCHRKTPPPPTPA